MESDFYFQKTAHSTDGPYNEECISCTPSKNENLIVGYSEHWKLLLHPWQAHLGSCLITSQRHVARLSKLNQEEKSEFFNIVDLYETTVHAAFGMKLINYSCLMNWAFNPDRQEPKFLNGKPNPHVHWHAITRYKDTIPFSGHVFEDPKFGDPYDGDRKQEVSLEVRREIISNLQQNIF